MKKVVITHIPLPYFFYYQWLILGLFELELCHEIVFKIKPKSIKERLFLRNYKLYLGLRKYVKLFTNLKKPDFLLKGYIFSNNIKQEFCFDIADTPYYFDVETLLRDVVYFKAQCPVTITNNGFELTPELNIPYHPDVLRNKFKIKPSMLGPGLRTYNIFSYKALVQGYKSLFVEKMEKSKKLMCYFGGNKGPEPIFSYQPDLYLNESHLLGYFGNRINHPNEKRGIAANIIKGMGDKYDGRVIREYVKGASSPLVNLTLFIPLAKYTNHISNFNYNLSISGFRKSIPYRFVYSFCVGTAIITDKLAVKWYLPFEHEVIETVDLGYLPNEAVDWHSFSQSITNLPEINPTDVLRAFEKKWSPLSFATYFVNSCIKKY